MEKKRFEIFIENQKSEKTPGTIYVVGTKNEIW